MKIHNLLLTEDAIERGGIAQQKQIVDALIDIKKIIVKKGSTRDIDYWKDINFASNKKGQQSADVSIDKSGKFLGGIESKARENGGLTSIYDKEMAKNSDKITEFDELAKNLAKTNGVVILQKDKANPKSAKPVPLEMLPKGLVFDAILTRGKAKDKKDCGRYGELNLNQQVLKLLKSKKYTVGDYFCSHKPIGFTITHPDSKKAVPAFFPRAGSLEENKKIYFMHKKSGNIVEKNVELPKGKGATKGSDFVNLNVNGRKIMALAPDGHLRPAADSGAVNRSCFSVKFTSETILSDDHPGQKVKEEAYKLITSHQGGKDDYFMLVEKGNIYPFITAGSRDPLNFKNFGVPTFSPNNIESVVLGTYGKARLGSIRLALKCGIKLSVSMNDIKKNLLSKASTVNSAVAMESKKHIQENNLNPIRKVFPNTAEEYAQEINSRLPQDATGKLVTSQAHWDLYGVRTGRELAEYLAKETYISLYKDKYGFKPRAINFDKLSLDQIEGAIEELHNLEDYNDYDYENEYSDYVNIDNRNDFDGDYKDEDDKYSEFDFEQDKWDRKR